MAERADIGEDVFEAGDVVEATIDTKTPHKRVGYKERYDIAVLRNGTVINMKDIVPNLSVTDKKIVSFGDIPGLLRVRNSHRNYLAYLALKKNDVLAIVGAFKKHDGNVKYELIYGDGSIKTEDVRLVHGSKVVYLKKVYYVEPSGKEHLVERVIMRTVPLVKISIDCSSNQVIAKGPLLGVLAQPEMKEVKYLEKEDIWVLSLRALKSILERAEVEIDCSIKSPATN